MKGDSRLIKLLSAITRQTDMSPAQKVVFEFVCKPKVRSTFLWSHELQSGEYLT